MTRTAAGTRGPSTRAATGGREPGASRRLTGGPSDGEVVAAWRVFLGSLPDMLASSPNAALALALAAEIDGDNSATSKAENGRVLLVIEKELRGQAPAEQPREVGGVASIAAGRAKRRARLSASAD